MNDTAALQFLSKLLSLCLALCLFAGALCACGGQAEPILPHGQTEQSQTEEITTEEITTAPPSAPWPAAGKTLTFPELSAPSAGLYCLETKTALYEKSADFFVAPASLTKLLTALTALENCGKETTFAVGDELSMVHSGSSLCLLAKGHVISLEDLIYGMLLPSGNDAAWVVAVHTARAVSGDDTMPAQAAAEYFCTMMNEKANALGAEDSVFLSPDGWDTPGQHTTVRDLAKIAKAALENETIRAAVACPQKYVVFASGHSITWKNTNPLLDAQSPYYRAWASGVKTGTTEAAGHCLIACAERQGKTYLAVVMGCADDDGRAADACALLDRVANGAAESITEP